MSTSYPIKVLLVTSYFPPIAGAGVYRWYNFLKVLGKKVQFYVLTRRPEQNEVLDESLLENLKNVSIYSINPVSFSAIYRKFKAGKMKMEGKGDEKLTFIQRFLQIPDQRIMEVPFLLSKGIDLIRKHGIEVVIATAPHYSYLIVGALLKRKFQYLKFIVDLRDPWSPSPLFPFITPLHKFFNEKIEKFVLTLADKVVVVNEQMKKLYYEKFPEISHKIRVVYNGFNEEELNMRKVPPKEDRVWFSYVGTLYAYRDPSPIIEGIKLIRDTLISKKASVLFVGELKPPWDIRLRKLIKENKVEDLIKIVGFVSKMEANGYLEVSDAFFHIVGDYSVGISGKIYEYLYFEKPICVIGNAAKIVLKLFEEIEFEGWELCNSPQEVASFISNYFSEKLHVKINRKKLLKYTRKNQAYYLLKVITEN